MTAPRSRCPDCGSLRMMPWPYGEDGSQLCDECLVIFPPPGRQVAAWTDELESGSDGRGASASRERAGRRGDPAPTGMGAARARNDHADRDRDHDHARQDPPPDGLPQPARRPSPATRAAAAAGAAESARDPRHPAEPAPATPAHDEPGPGWIWQPEPADRPATEQPATEQPEPAAKPAAKRRTHVHPDGSVHYGATCLGSH